MRRLGIAGVLLGLCAGAGAADLARLGDPPWREAGLPRQTLPMTRFARVDLDGRQVLRITSDASYGNLVTPVRGGRTLSWSWRLDRPLAGADLRRKAGDDTALKVCAMFDLPLAALSIAEQARMELARTVAGEHLPAATLCYVWDPTLPAGTQLPNAYTPRLRWWVLRGSGTPLQSWQAETRDLQADFLQAFGSDTQTVPPLVTLGVGADADNTRGQGLGYVVDLRLQP
ncbi:MAG: DUF3047 domain-containing protein [Rubrivivax sp.]|nr:DUF3047 domain-containing protein [Rubrivivax sp.]MDH5338289.1 DUF3047 domain-containing protein [Rubrivivax sp.]